jgi:FkbM family methyltransferase
MKHLAHLLFKAPEFKGRTRLIRLLLAPLRSARSVYGPRMCVDAKDYTNLAALFGAYGMELYDLIKRLPTDGIFIDIGANAGIYTLIASQHLHEGKVLSFEPNPKVFANLLENLDLNDCQNVIPLNAAVGQSSDVLEITIIESHTGAGFVMPSSAHAHAHAHAHVSRPVACLTFSDLPFAKKLFADRKVLCKIDVEGAERTVIWSLSDSGLLESLDQIYIEICAKHLERFGTSPDEIYAELRDRGFVPLKGLQSAVSYDELFENAR